MTQCPVLFNSDFGWNIPIYGETINNVSFDPTTSVLQVVYTNGGMALYQTVGNNATNTIITAPNPEQAALQLIAASTQTGYPTNYAAPSIVGTPSKGSTIYVRVGSWCYSPTAYGYQWFRNNLPIIGATGQIYTIQNADVGATLIAQVTATNQYGTSAPVSSASFGPVSG